jgi:ABC-type branched-subunit amino acid transport system ATPase component/branched-subunit amino acid ABC-type transport system permease component
VSNFIQFAVLGLAASSIYALLGSGAVLIYRSSGIVNFAQAAFAMFGAYAYAELTQLGLPVVAAILTSAVLTALLGFISYFLVIRPLRTSAPLARTISTLGILAILTAAGTLRYGANETTVPAVFPTSNVTVGGVTVPAAALYLIAFAVVVTGALYCVYRFTHFGRATTAVAESEVSAAALGVSPDLVSSANWAISCGLAALAGVFEAPLTLLTVNGMTLLIVPALAAALMGMFRSFWWTLAGGVIIGILQSDASNYIHASGWPTAVPFIVIVGVLVGRGKALPVRGSLIERLPALGSGRVRPIPFLITVVLGVVLLLSMPLDWSIDATTSITWALMMLSVVVLTGYAGQLSLTQFALGGVGALITARFAAHGIPLPLTALIGVAGTVIVGVLLGLPALRTRGVNLAVITLGLGAALADVLFNNPSYMGGADGTDVGPQSFFGISIDALLRPRTYAIFCLAWLVVFGLVVANLRRSRSGLHLIAIRENERAAAALGIRVTAVKIYAFGIGAALAGASGILFGLTGYTVTYNEFTPVNSVLAVGLAVVGSIGFVSGTPVGSVLAVGGIGTIVGNAIFGANNGQQVVALIGGIALIGTLIANPNGIAWANGDALRKLGGRFRRGERQHQQPVLASDGRPLPEISPKALTVESLGVRYGGVTALENVSLSVAPGQIVGLIGPNGAGKTTFIDCVTGFVAAHGGSVRLDNQPINGYSPHQCARAGISRTFQALELFDDLTVMDNLAAADHAHPAWRWLTDLVYPARKELSDAAYAAIQAFGLETDLQRSVGDLSYGRRRLVAVVRALSAQPSVLLLDEPAAGLDEDESHTMALAIQQIAQNWNISVLVIEHDMRFIASICDDVTVLDFGHKIAAGDPRSVMNDPAVITAYLGEEAASQDEIAESSVVADAELLGVDRTQ